MDRSASNIEAIGRCGLVNSDEQVDSIKHRMESFLCDDDDDDDDDDTKKTEINPRFPSSSVTDEVIGRKNK